MAARVQADVQTDHLRLIPGTSEWKGELSPAGCSSEFYMLPLHTCV